MIPATDYGPRIRALHADAHRLADEAIDRAKEAGRLLLEAKRETPHGEWGKWVEANCGFTDRTARRYMRLYENREALPEGAGIKAALDHIKTDTVSELPAWLPAGGAVEHDDGNGTIITVWHLGGPYANALRRMTHAGGELCDALRRGIRADHIGRVLETYGMANPARVAWQPADADMAEAYRRFVFEEVTE